MPFTSRSVIEEEVGRFAVDFAAGWAARGKAAAAIITLAAIALERIFTPMITQDFPREFRFRLGCLQAELSQ